MSLPENPADGTIFEIRPGQYLIYKSSTKSWMKAEGGFMQTLASSTRDGLMSSVDYVKLESLLVPPPQITLTGNASDFKFTNGVIELRSGDQFVTIDSTSDLYSRGVLDSTVKKDLHRYTSAFDIDIDKAALLQWLEQNDKVKIRAPVGLQGPPGESGDDGADYLDIPAPGPAGDQGPHASFNITVSAESVPFELLSGVTKAIVKIEAERISQSENYLVFTRANVGNEYACPSKVVISDNNNSPWLLCMPLSNTIVTIDGVSPQSDTGVNNENCPPGAVTNTTSSFSCSKLYYVDITTIVDNIRDKFFLEAERVKTGIEDVVNYWLSNMSSLFDSQKSALCCALESCRSKSRNDQTQRYLEAQRIQLAQANFKAIVTNGEDDYTTTKNTYDYVDFSAPASNPGAVNDRRIELSTTCAITSIQFTGKFETIGTNARISVIYDGATCYSSGCTESAAISFNGGCGGDATYVTVRVTSCDTEVVHWRWELNVNYIVNCSNDKVSVPICDAPEILGVQQVNSDAVSSDKSNVVANSESEDITVDLNLRAAENVVILSNDTAVQYKVFYIKGKSKQFEVSERNGKVRYATKLAPGEYYMYIVGPYTQQPINLQVLTSNIKFIAGAGNGFGWKDSFISPDGSCIKSDKGPLSSGWWVKFKILDDTSEDVIVKLDVSKHSGLLKNAYKMDLPMGSYIAELVDTTAKFDDKYGGTFKIQYRKDNQFKTVALNDYGRYDNINDSRVAYRGKFIRFRHDGGEVAIIANTSNSINHGTIALRLIDDILYYNTQVYNKPVIKTEYYINDNECSISNSIIKWYADAWKSGESCGYVVNISGQKYIISRRSIGNDLTCGGGESKANACVQKFLKISQPAFAWPTLDGVEFAGLPNSGDIVFKYNKRFSDASRNKRATNDVDGLRGDCEFELILFPVMI